LKKIILLLIITFSFSLTNLENKLISYTLEKIFNKKFLIVYTNEKVYPPLIKAKCNKNVDIVIGNLNCLNKPKFLFSYQSLIKDKNAIGAFYWSHGRPQIIFLKKRLKEFNLSIPKELYEYIY